MRRIMLVLGMMVTALILVGCTGQGEGLTPPSFVSVKVEDTDPVSGGDFVTFFRAKEQTVTVEVTLNNPDNVNIKSIVIDGYTHTSARFLDQSTRTRIYIDVNVGTTLGQKIYSVDRINYLDGETSLAVSVTTNNEFEIYVYKDVPTVTRENYELTENTVSIDFNVIDVDDVISAGSLKAQLYSGETLAQSFDLSTGLSNVVFFGLLADRLYEVKIVASYNLDDNKGTQANMVLYSGTYTTLSNGLPSASIQNVNVTSNTVYFDVDFTDDDNVTVAGGLSVAIYNGETLVDHVDISGSTDGLHFEDLLNDNEYTLKVLADYNLGDGQGIRLDNVLAIHTFSTLPRQVPLPQLVNLDLRENSIEFDVAIADPLGIIDENSLIARLYIEDVFVDEAELFNYHVDFQVNNLFANKAFRIDLIGDYDLNDGNGVQPGEIIFSQVYNTLENALPTVGVESMVVSQGYITLGLDVSDVNDTLIGAIEAILYEEGTAVQTIQLDVETTEIVFDYATKAGLTYYIEFFADYNLRDGSGAVFGDSLRRIVSFTAEAKKPIAEISSVAITTSTVDFDVRIIDADETIIDNSSVVYLYLGDTLVAQQALGIGMTSVSFSNLQSNSEYRLVVRTDYDLDDGSGVLSNQLLINQAVVTAAKVIPTSAITNTDTTDTAISFNAEIFDPDAVVAGGSVVAVLYFEGAVVTEEALINGENFDITFDGLLSDSNYRVRIYLDYDLNDGNGVTGGYQVAELNISTQPKQPPVATFQSPSADEDSISALIEVTDAYDVVVPGTLKAILMLGDTATGDEVDLDIGFTSVTFDTLFSNAQYRIDVVADYDLNDGEPVIIGEILETEFITTAAYDMVAATLANVSSTVSSITFDVTVEDPSAIITGNLQAVLYQSDVATGDTIALAVGDNTGVSFTGLDSNTEYKIQIETDYDLNEESGPVLAYVLDTAIEATPPLSPPTATVVSFVEDYESFTVNINVNNEDGTITGTTKAVLYKDDVATGQEVALTDGLNTNVSFTGLLSDNQYEVRVITDYDINDGSGEQLAVELTSGFVTTLAKTVPVTNVDSLVLTRDRITFDLGLDDVFDVLAPGTLKAGLYYNDTLQAEKLLFTSQVTFDISGFLADYDFEIRISGNYDLNDGNGVVVDGPIDTLSFTTIANATPTADITDITINQNTVDVTVVVTDADDTITENLVVKLFDKDDVEIDALTLSVGVQTASFTYTVNHGEFYSVVVYADYNLKDGAGETDAAVLAEALTSVYNKLLPQAVVDNVTTAQESITFDATVYDNDLVIIGATTFAELYLDGTKVDDIALVVGANNGLSFTGLQSDSTYVIRLVTNYDNGDGNGTYTHYQMTVATHDTLAKDAPSADITLDTVTGSTLIFDIVVSDGDSVSSALEANLYDDEGTLVDTAALSVGNNINVTFSGLTGSTEYTVEVEADFDLNNGNGTVTGIIAELTETTPESAVPVGALNTVVPTTSTIAVNYSFTDDDNVSTEQYLRLYEGAVLVEELAITTGANQTHTFDELAPNTSYTVTIESTYDLNDLEGVQTDKVLATSSPSTASLISIDNETIDKKSNELDVLVDDNESILTGATMTATLKQGATEIDSFIISTTAPTNIDMVNLLSDYDYTLEIEATYDVGAGNVTDVIYTHAFTTDALEQPTVEIQDFADWTIGGNVSLDVTIGADGDNVATDTTWTAELYVDGVLQDTVDIYVANGSSNPEDAGAITITFTGYATVGGESYTVVITADVDMNDLPATGAVETELASKAGVDAGN